MNLAVFKIGSILLAAPSKPVETIVSTIDGIDFDLGPTWIDSIVTYNGRQVLAIDLAQVLKIESGDLGEAVIVNTNGDYIAIKIDKFVGYMDVPDNTKTKQFDEDNGPLKGFLSGVMELDAKKYYLLNFINLNTTQIFTGSHI